MVSLQSDGRRGLKNAAMREKGQGELGGKDLKKVF